MKSHLKDMSDKKYTPVKRKMESFQEFSAKHSQKKSGVKQQNLVQDWQQPVPFMNLQEQPTHVYLQQESYAP